MKIYETMTLADFLAANWMELPPELVRLLERTQVDLDEALDDAEAWHDNYESVLDAANYFKRSIENIVSDVGDDLQEVLNEIKEECDHTSFDL